MKNKLTFLFAFLLIAHISYAQCRGIKRIIHKGADSGCYINGQLSDGYGYPGFTVNPGDTLAFQADTDWSYIGLENIAGTATCPIVVINEGGQVVLAGPRTKFSINNCRYIKLTGTGSSSYTYGFKAHHPANVDLRSDSNGVGFQVIGRSSNIYVEKIETRRKTYGMWIKQDPGCIDSMNYPNWHMDNIKVFNCRFDSTGQDVIYAGNTGPTGEREVRCDSGRKKTFPIPLRLSNIELAYLEMDYANRTGIQLSGCDSGNNSIHHCTITRMGFEYNEHQGTGISLGGMTTNTRVYQNTIKNTYLYGLMCLGAGKNYFYNNSLDSSGWLNGIPNRKSNPEGMYIDTRDSWNDSSNVSANNQGIALDSSTVIVCSNLFGANASTSGSDIYIEDTRPIYNHSGSIIGNNTRRDGAPFKIRNEAAAFNYSTNCSDTTAAADGFTIPGKLQAENWTAMSGVQKEPTWDNDGGENVGYIDYGDWIEYKLYAQTANTFAVQFRIASPNSGAQFQVKDSSGAVLATVNVPVTGGWQTWQTISATFNLPSGTQTLRLVSTGSAWNINWIDFQYPIPVTGTRIEGEDWTNMSGAQNQPTTDIGGGENVGYIDPGDWVEYNITPSTAGTYKFDFRLATHFSGAQFNIYSNGTLIAGPVNLPHTGGWQTWQNFAVNVNLPAGPQTIRLVSLNTSGWNINWWEYSFLGSTVSNSLRSPGTQEALAEVKSQHRFTIYPNPVSEQLVVELDNDYNGLMKVTVTNMLGAVQKEFNIRKQAGRTMHNLLLNELGKGQYILSVQMGSKKLTTKFIKK